MNKPTIDNMADNGSDKRLDALLVAADPATGPDMTCDGQDDLSRRVMSLQRSRRNKRRIAGTALTLVSAVAAAFVLLSLDNRPTPKTASGPAVEKLNGTEHTATDVADIDPLESTPAIDPKAELAQIYKDIRQLRETLRHSRRQAQYRRRLAELRRRVGRPDPFVLAQIQLEKAAYILVARAAREETLGLPDSDSTATYQKAIELFPSTTWAKVAQNRLDNPLRKTDSPLNYKQEGTL